MRQESRHLSISSDFEMRLWRLWRMRNLRLHHRTLTAVPRISPVVAPPTGQGEEGDVLKNPWISDTTDLI